MLDAYLKKGARLPTESSGGRRIIEDVITSTLFSPLKFMTPGHAGKILSWLTKSRSDENAEVQSIQLWPRFAVDEKSANEHTIEPDLVIDGFVGGEPFRWIIEVKWDAILLRPQIEDQVRICARGLHRWLHISLVKSAELAAFEFPDTTILQWNEALGILRGVSRSDATEDASLTWCRDAVAFLEKLGVGTFAGFGRLSLAPVTVEAGGFSIRREFEVGNLVDVEAPVFFSLRSSRVK